MEYAILFGGESYEHEISIVSAIALKDIVKKAIFIFIDQEREFYLIDKENLKASYFSSYAYKKASKLELKRGGFFQKGFLKEKKLLFDIAINLVHGADGEDGKLASLLEFFGIDYIGPRVEGSVISYNKLFTKLYLKEVGCNVLEYQVISKQDIQPIAFEYPVILKPLRLGSSIGVSVVKDESELSYALDVAFEFDEEVLVEPFIEGIKEYNLAGAKGSSWMLSKLEEVQKKEYLDFKKKYMDFATTQKIQEAEILPIMRERVEECFKKIYNPLFLGSIIRVDFFIHQDRIYVNEINPVPGSLANYLFDDFLQVLDKVSRNLPKKEKPQIEYRYISSISAKK